MSIVQRRLGLNAPQTARDDAPETAPDASRAWFFSSKYTHTHKGEEERRQAHLPERRHSARESKRAREPKNQRETEGARAHTHTETHFADATEWVEEWSLGRKRETERKSQRGEGERQRNRPLAQEKHSRSLAQEKHSQKKHSAPRGPDRE